MSLPLKSGPVSDMRDDETRDRISNLPDDLLGYILSFLPTKMAVGTSVLSTRWRFLFTLLTNLCFTNEPNFVGWGRRGRTAVESFKEYVYRVLVLHKMSPIKRFSLDCGGYNYESSHLRVWISAGITKGVQELSIQVDPKPNMLPECLFNCQTLVKLEIIFNNFSYYDFKVPGSILLPSLRILKLCEVRFLDGDSVKRFFSGCQLLEELDLSRCLWVTEDHVCLTAEALKILTIVAFKGYLKIDTPGLVNLTYTHSDVVDVSSSLNSCSLFKVDLCFMCPEDYGSSQVVQDLIRGAYNARDLILSFDCVKLLSWGGNEQIPTYPKVQFLELGACSTNEWKYVMYWLANSPQLEKLVFNESLVSCKEDDRKWPTNVTLSGFSSNLKSIEVHSFRGYKLDLIALRHMLEYAGALKQVILFRHRSMAMDREVRVKKVLLILPKASAQCTIELKDTPNESDDTQ